MNIRDWLRTTYEPDKNGMLKTRPRLKCKDGFSISVQASKYMYCHPSTNLLGGEYNSVELGFPSEEEPLIRKYAECDLDLTGTVYGYVPISIVTQVIEKHGGIEY